MADAVSTQVISDGQTSLVIKLTNISDGTGESQVTKVSASTYSAGSFLIEKIWFATVGMAVDILFDATSDSLAISIPQDMADELDFRDFGGIPDPKGTGYTGNIQFTTVGHTLGDRYTIILYLRKNA